MNFLSIDCSTEIGSFFVKTKNKTFSKLLQNNKFHNDLLMKQILDFFEENNLKLGDISEILINQGPGNFSGLRGSLAVAIGISVSKNIKLFGYDTFLWLSAKFFKKKKIVCSIIKLRDKYFIKRFDNKLKVQSQIKEISIEEIINNYEKEFKVIAKDAERFFDKKIIALNNLEIVDLDHNVLEFLRINNLLNKDLIKPLYLS
tara:strand:+ start:464 stop:1069 length:606 start_codon:yes stop_codon:yes gene_type:complete